MCHYVQLKDEEEDETATDSVSVDTRASYHHLDTVNVDDVKLQETINEAPATFDDFPTAQDVQKNANVLLLFSCDHFLRQP